MDRDAAYLKAFWHHAKREEWRKSTIENRQYSESIPTNKMFTCRMCGVVFDSKESRDYHLAYRHPIIHKGNG